ncbi:MAG: 3'-5' exonuclease [Clostridium sp.]
MSTCLSCSKKGLFLKLKFGLCSDCYDELSQLEDKYQTILNDFNNPDINKTQLIISLNSLIVKLRKFDDVSKSIKTDDCMRLLNTINLIDSPLKEINLQEKNYSQKSKSIKPVNAKISTNIKSVDITNQKASSLSSIKTLTDELTTPSLINDNTKLLTNDNIQTSHIIDEKKHNPILKEDNFKNLIDKDTINEIPDTTLLDEISSLENTDDYLTEKHDKEFILERDALNSIVHSNLINDARNIIDTLMSTTLNTDDLAYYTFLLRDTYLKPLTQNNIFEIDDYNVADLINDNLKKLSLLVNCPTEDLYDFFNYVAFSIQTTGIRTEINDILEISAVKIKFGQIEGKFHTLINPLRSIGIAISKRTGLTNESIHDAPTLLSALDSFTKFSNGFKLISHNSNFNYSFINYYYNKLNSSDLSNKTECTMQLYRKRYKSFHGEPPKKFDLTYCCEDILIEESINEINNLESICDTSAIATYKLYEILKYRYK